MDARAAVSLWATSPRCCVVSSDSLLGSCSARRLRSCRGLGSPLRSWSARSSAPAVRICPAAGTTTAAEPEQEKEKDLVFVAGATGKVGSRTVRELIKLGFRVRAAVRSKARADALVKSIEQLELGEGGAASLKLEVVECDLEKTEGPGIAAAVGNAAVVVCSIGASEKEILDVTGPYRIDYLATSNLVQAAAAARVEHFILVTSLGTSKIGFPAFLLNLFWGVLVWKRRAEEALMASGVPYTIVRPGGMERPTDTYKETHNLVVAPQDTYVGGLVSNLQVAELIACAAKNREAAYCKVVEVVAETTAPLLPIEDLLARIPSDLGRTPPAAAAPAQVIASETKDLPPPPPSAAGARAERPLSPYTTFVDLKPPASPSPTPPPAATPPDAAISTRASSRDAATTVAAASASSSPSPDPNANGTPITSDPQRPLSPYARYHGLKPPASPTPSARKV